MKIVSTHLYQVYTNEDVAKKENLNTPTFESAKIKKKPK